MKWVSKCSLNFSRKNSVKKIFNSGLPARISKNSPSQPKYSHLFSSLSLLSLSLFVRFVNMPISSGQLIYMTPKMVHVRSTSTVEHDKIVNNHCWINPMHISSKKLNRRYSNWWNMIHIRDFSNRICTKNVLWMKWKANRFHIFDNNNNNNRINNNFFRQVPMIDRKHWKLL